MRSTDVAEAVKQLSNPEITYSAMHEALMLLNTVESLDDEQQRFEHLHLAHLLRELAGRLMRVAGETK